MAKNPSPRIPKYRRQRRPHSPDDAFVDVGGQRHYLGVYGSPESKAAYRKTIAEWVVSGGHPPVPADDITVTEICARFWQHAREYYKKPDGTPTSTLHKYQSVLRSLKHLYGPNRAVSFGPRSLKAVRQAMVDKSWCRRTVDNHMIAHTQGVLRETHAAKDHPDNPIFKPYSHFPMFICPDPEHGYRLYYNSEGYLMHVAYSQDAINWEIPELDVFDLGSVDPERFPGGPNNVIGSGEIHGLIHEPDDSDPDRRWKAILGHRDELGHPHPAFPYLAGETASAPLQGRSKPLGRGLPYELFVSPDGYHWRFEAETNHWKGPRAEVDAPDRWPLSGSDAFRVRWDPVLGKYIGNTKLRIGPDHRFTPVLQSARVVCQTESDDLIHWSAPRLYAYPDGTSATGAHRSPQSRSTGWSNRLW